MKALLDGNGSFQKSEALLGNQATRENLLHRFQSLYQEVRRTDLLVIYFCGHGRQVPATAQTSEPASATDDFDETWVLYDDDLIDDEFQRITDCFVHRPRIPVIADNCHAGGLIPLHRRGANAINASGGPSKYSEGFAFFGPSDPIAYALFQLEIQFTLHPKVRQHLTKLTRITRSWRRRSLRCKRKTTPPLSGSDHLIPTRHKTPTLIRSRWRVSQPPKIVSWRRPSPAAIR